MRRSKDRNRMCPKCHGALVAQGDLRVCPRCLLICRGDTFEPLTREALGLTSLYDYFFRT